MLLRFGLCQVACRQLCGHNAVIFVNQTCTRCLASIVHIRSSSAEHTIAVRSFASDNIQALFSSHGFTCVHNPIQETVEAPQGLTSEVSSPARLLTTLIVSTQSDSAWKSCKKADV